MRRLVSGRDLRTRVSFANWTLTLVTAVVTFALLVLFSEHGIAPKWVTATVGTSGVFGYVLYVNRESLRKLSFWGPFVVCLIVHSALTYAVLQYVLGGVRKISIWLCLPILLAEFFVLLILIKRSETFLTGRQEKRVLRL